MTLFSFSVVEPVSTEKVD